MSRVLVLVVLIAPALVALAPTAAADCALDDPTGATTTCVGDWAHETGDDSCRSDGYRYGSTWVWSGAPGLVTVSAAGESWCHHSGSWNHGGQSVRAGAGVSGVLSIGIRYTEWSHSGASHCVATVYVHTPAYVLEYPKSCKGGLPQVPWGGVLPG